MKTSQKLLTSLIVLSALGACGETGSTSSSISANNFGNQEVIVDQNYQPKKYSENTELKDLMEGKTYVSGVRGKEYRLLYRIYIPENYNPSYKYPLVMYFHGLGECGSNNTNQLSLDFDFLPRILNQQNLKDYPCIVVAPQCPIGEYWINEEKGDQAFNKGYDVNTVKTARSMQASLNLISQLQKDYNIDKDRLYVTGVSLGGAASWDIVARNPGVFAACMPVCGACMPIENFESFKNTNVWAFHGKKDPLIRYTNTESMINAINSNGGKAYVTLYEDADHTLCWKYAFVEEKFLDFMFTSRRGILNPNKPI